MSKNTKKLVPKLRFPEFRDAGDWTGKKIESFANFLKGKGISKSDISSDGKTRCIRYGELYTQYDEVINSVISKTNLPVAELFFSKKNDVILPSSGETKWDIATASCVLIDDIALGGDLNVIRSNENGVFLSYYLNGPKKLAISKIAQGDAVVHLYSSQLKLLDLLIPKDPKEQQKIADCLSSIDDLITAQSQKVEALKIHQKGLMQHLFPREGETVPRLRFPEFQGDWLLVPLGQCFNNIGGTALEKYVTEGARHHFISIGNYSPEGKYIDKGQRVEINELTKTKLLNKNNLVMVLNDKTLAGDIIGSTLLIDEDDKYIYNQRSERLIVSNYFSPVFAWHLLNSEIFRKQVFKLSQGGTQIYVNFPAIKAIELCFPKNPNEQQKIADCLSSINDLINAQSQKLETLKTHKKGLMQQLFPSTETESK